MKPSDQYLKIVEWSEEDGCYVGRDLHQKLAVEAVREGVSLNSYCVRRLRGESRKKKRANKRAKRTG